MHIHSCAFGRPNCGSRAIWRCDGTPWPWKGLPRVALECMQVGMGWGEWTIQVEHSSTGDRGWLHGWIHCIRPFVCVPQFELRFVMVRVGYGGVMVCHGHEGVALEYMQMGMGWVEWASQVEHSSRGEQSCMWACTHPFVRVRQFELRFACDMAV
jgi:hypothetical protein